MKNFSYILTIKFNIQQKVSLSISRCSSFLTQLLQIGEKSTSKMGGQIQHLTKRENNLFQSVETTLKCKNVVIRQLSRGISLQIMDNGLNFLSTYWLVPKVNEMEFMFWDKLCWWSLLFLIQLQPRGQVQPKNAILFFFSFYFLEKGFSFSIKEEI